MEVAAPAEPVPAMEAAAPEAGVAAEPAAAEAPGAEAVATVAPATGPLQRWRELAPLGDATLAAALERRVEQWQRAHEDAAQARRTERRERAADRDQAVRQERLHTLTVALEQAEAALAAGHLGDTHKHLEALDELLKGGPAGALRTRIDAVQAEYARLKGWQRWGGSLARDDLVAQAEALAAVAAPPAEGEAPRPKKLPLKQHGDAIDNLRARWKELDRLGGPTSKALWQRFDAALKTAYQPVAAHLEQQRAVRQKNLEAREALIAALDAVPLPAAQEGEPAPEWKPVGSALDHFHTEWRKLGPVEHTVPHKARDKLAARMAAAVQRLEAPLAEARRVAQAERERLIERAGALASEAASGAPGRDLVGRVRELQSQWQQHAKSLPLARGVESALWNRFKAALDAVFAARDAAGQARDAEFKRHGAERQALIERLETLSPDAPASELGRTLADVTAQWQRLGPAPRNEAAALEARFRRAHEAVRQLQAGSAQRRWNATCDALEAKLALCEVLERAGEAAQASADAQWNTLPGLPPAWEQALAGRRAAASADAAQGTAPAGAAHGTAPADDLLLQLEAAYDVPSPPAFQAARRDLKLHAMKAALERRTPAAAPPASPARLLAEALGRPGLDETQRARLGAVITALRSRGPASAH